MAEHLEPEAKESKLLELPAELRNRINRLAINQDEDTAVDILPSGIQEPGLVRTCKRIRREAITIYYGDNTFNLQSVDFDSDLCLHWCVMLSSLRTKYKVRTVQVTITILGRRNWDNLRVWLQRFHSGLVRGGPLPDGNVSLPSGLPTSLEMHVMATLFPMINIIQRSHTWEEVEPLVELQHKTLIALHANWQ